MWNRLESVNFADKLVCENTKWSIIEDRYVLMSENIDRSDLHKLASYLMKEHEQYTSEGTGPDNKEFKKMKNALIDVMQESWSMSSKVDFADDYIDGMYEYVRESVEELLMDRVKEYNKQRESE